MSYELLIRTPRYLTDDEAQEIDDLVREMIDSDPIEEGTLDETIDNLVRGMIDGDKSARAEIFAKLDMIEQQLDEIVEDLNALED